VTVTVSLGCEVFRESHAKGLVNFLVGGAGSGLLPTGAGGGGGGGGAHGTDGRAPDNPCKGLLEAFGGSGGFEFWAITS